MTTAWSTTTGNASAVRRLFHLMLVIILNPVMFQLKFLFVVVTDLLGPTSLSAIRQRVNKVIITILFWKVTTIFSSNVTFASKALKGAMLCTYRVFSLTWPAYMQINWNKKKRLHKKRVQLPEGWFGIPTWPPFHCFGTPIWPPWRHVKTLYSSHQMRSQ